MERAVSDRRSGREGRGVVARRPEMSNGCGDWQAGGWTMWSRERTSDTDQSLGAVLVFTCWAAVSRRHGLDTRDMQMSERSIPGELCGEEVGILRVVLSIPICVGLSSRVL